MLQVGIISLFPEMFRAITDCGVTGRAVQKGLIALRYWNPRDFTRDVHRTVDDRPYGGGPGMVMLYEPLQQAIAAARAAYQNTHVVALSPQGQRFNQQAITGLLAKAPLVLVAGRYEGIDERLLQTHIDAEWSIGDYVLSGGELAAMVMVDALIRTLPGALGHADSAQEDSFTAGWLDCPHYTRPEEVDGMHVPEVLLGGNHAEIRRWRLREALGRTWLRRPDLLERQSLDTVQQRLLDEFITEYRLRHGAS
jgi:tRNA (guanine37-N1)-methyltransferase